MRTEADGQVRISTERATGKVSFVRSTDGSDLLPSTGARTQGAAVDKAAATSTSTPPRSAPTGTSWSRPASRSDRLGTIVTYTQEFDGVSGLRQPRCASTSTSRAT